MIFILPPSQLHPNFLSVSPDPTFAGRRFPSFTEWTQPFAFCVELEVRRLSSCLMPSNPARAMIWPRFDGRRLLESSFPVGNADASCSEWTVTGPFPDREQMVPENRKWVQRRIGFEISAVRGSPPICINELSSNRVLNIHYLIMTSIRSTIKATKQLHDQRRLIHQFHQHPNQDINVDEAKSAHQYQVLRKFRKLLHCPFLDANPWAMFGVWIA